MDKVYVVLRNADSTEGRGPMLLHAAFSDGEEAIKYVEKQGGIFGSKQEVVRGKYGHYASGNGYQIVEQPVYKSGEDIETIEREQLRARALGKLSEEEREVLGIK